MRRTHLAMLGGGRDVPRPRAADLHVHSRFSNRPTEWILKRLGAPESYTDPLVVYRRCRDRGMTFVTLTDHDTIDGALEIAHLPGVFLSSEVTVEFPEDGCLIHCLVYGIDEAQHREIQRLRSNVYELRDYLYDEGIACAVAHPLFRVNDRLDLGHLEKLLVLFKAFEGLNGAHDARAGAVVRSIVNNLSPRFLEELSNRHDLDPRDPEPWQKVLTAGSDDHSGLYIASAWTACSGETDVAGFLRALRRGGDFTMEGVAGSSLKLGRSLHRIGSRYARSRAVAGDAALPLWGWFADRIVGCDAAAPRQDDAGAARGPSPAPPPAATHLPRFVADVVQRELAAGANVAEAEERSAYRLASRVGERVAVEAVRRAADALRDGRIGGAMEALSGLLPAVLCIAPYLTAFRVQHKDEPLVRDVAKTFPSSRLLEERSGRTAWFADSFLEAPTPGSALTGLAVSVAGAPDRLELLRLAVGATPAGTLAGRSFEPISQLSILASPAPPVPIPPLLELLEYCESARFDRVLLSSPGPMGLAAKLVATCLNLPLVAIWRPQAIERLLRACAAASAAAASAAAAVPEPAIWSYLRWLYGGAQEVLTCDRSDDGPPVERRNGFDDGDLARESRRTTLTLVC